MLPPTLRPFTDRLHRYLANRWFYPLWRWCYDRLTPARRREAVAEIATWQEPPLISVIMPVYNPPARWLRAALDSVRAQMYPHWQLCVADDGSDLPHVRRILQAYAARDERIQVDLSPPLAKGGEGGFATLENPPQPPFSKGGGIAAASNRALALARGEFTAFLDHDDCLAPHALWWLVRDILAHPQGMLWYSDEDKLNAWGLRCDPYFKCDWNPDLMLSHNLITHLAVYRTRLLRELGGLREGFDGAQDYDLALRAVERIETHQIRHIPKVLYHWRMSAGSTARHANAKPHALHAAHRAIGEHLSRRGLQAEVSEAPGTSGMTRVRYALPETPPLVTIIIPTRNQLALLRQCLDSLRTRTTYPRYEILVVDNGSNDPPTLAWLAELAQAGVIRLLPYPRPFNYAAMNNRAVAVAHGELVCLLNNDVEVISPDWLEEMAGQLLRPGIGAVGARLWYPDDTLQHGGVILGIGGVAGHGHKGLPRGRPGYLSRAVLLQNLSAVTGACLLMRKADFLAVGGLDARHLPVAFNDVDLCLRLQARGLRIVWTPYAELYHHESASRGYADSPDTRQAHAYMRERWGDVLARDPAYSPNLTLTGENFGFAWPPRMFFDK